MSISEQETFDRVVRHLLTQASKSVCTYPQLYGIQGCAYRGRGGNKCAIGALIPDDKYDVKFEGSTVVSHPVNQVVSSLGYPIRLCTHLQEIHDLVNVVNWPSGLRDIANRYNLDSSVVDSLEPEFQKKVEAEVLQIVSSTGVSEGN